MTAQLIHGNKIADSIRQTIARDVQSYVAQGKRPPHLAVILVGDDPASHIYVHHKEKNCAKVGIKSTIFRFPASLSQTALNQKVKELNADAGVDGILVQLPLPEQLNRLEALDLISPSKDVDGLTPTNQGLMVWNRPGLYSCTPLGILELIRSTGVTIQGKLACMVGASVLVGAPTATLLTHADATVVTLHSQSTNKEALARQADILVVATGVRHLVTKEWVKKGAVVIDVGMHRDANGITGDVDFAEVKNVAGYITPVPGGVGPMTIAMLLKNCLQAYKAHLHLS